jgi:hypothetical protein
VRPTRLSVLLAAAVVAGAVSYLIVRSAYGSLPTLPRFAPASLAIVAVAEGLLALGTRSRLARKPGTHPIEPMLVARYAALAKATSLVGALVTGAYVGLLIYVSSLSGPTPHDDTVTAAFGTASSVAVVAAALALERTCRVKQRPDKPESADQEH